MNIAVFFGGKSCEHNISVITGMQTIKALSQDYRVIPIFIDNDGYWWTGKELGELDTYRQKKKVAKRQVHIRSGDRGLFFNSGKMVARIDCAILATHGFGGEDGALQGALTLSNIPYTGSSIAGSVLGMDKILMKKVFAKAGLPIVNYVSFTKKEYRENMFLVVEKIKKNLDYPLIIKPAKTGSSIGISYANDSKSLYEGLEGALEWDNAVVVESALSEFTEFNCAVICGDGREIVSEIEQPILWEKFLSYEDKYEKKQKGEGRIFPSRVSDELRERIQKLALSSYKEIGASGVARIDFLYKDDNLYVNEINTIPGALSNYLFSAGKNKMSFSELLDLMIDIALENKKNEDDVSYVYKSTYSLRKNKM